MSRALPALRHGQRGVALITAVLIVALAVILAADVSFKGYLDQRRFATTFALDQGFQVALGAEAWAADILQRDAQESRETDHLGEEWATPLPPLPIEGGQIEGLLEDMQGRFNINNLVDASGAPNPAQVARFQRLLEILELEPKWTDVIVDWIDPDGNPSNFNGAEDNVYTSLTPPYRAPNMPISRVSELLAMAELDLEVYRRLEPFVTALPMGTRINVCTASPEVLDALMLTETQYTQARDQTAEQRKQQGCYPRADVFLAPLQPGSDERQQLEAMIGERTSYLRATIWVTIGTTQFTLYSLLYRPDNANLVRPILRSFGTT